MRGLDMYTKLWCVLFTCSLMHGMEQEQQEIFDAYKKELGNVSIEPCHWLESTYPDRGVISGDGAWFAVPGKAFGNNSGNVTWWALASDALTHKKKYTFTEHDIPHIFFRENDNKIHVITQSHFSKDSSVKLYVINCLTGELERSSTLVESILSSRYLQQVVCNDKLIGLHISELFLDSDYILCLDHNLETITKFAVSIITSFKSNSQGTLCAFTYYDGVRLWQTKYKNKNKLEELPSIKRNNEAYTESSISFNKAGTLLAILFSSISKLEVWEVADPDKATKQYEIVCPGAYDVMSDNRIILVHHTQTTRTNKDKNSVTIWESGKRVFCREIITQATDWSSSGIESVIASPKDTTVVMSLKDGTLLVWKI
jgi:hypothetical protein